MITTGGRISMPTERGAKAKVNPVIEQGQEIKAEVRKGTARKCRGELATIGRQRGRWEKRGVGTGTKGRSK